MFSPCMSGIGPGTFHTLSHLTLITAQKDGSIFTTEAWKGQTLLGGPIGGDTIQMNPSSQSLWVAFHLLPPYDVASVPPIPQRWLHKLPGKPGMDSSSPGWAPLTLHRLWASGQTSPVPAVPAVPGQSPGQGPADTWPRPSQADKAGKSPCLSPP